MSLSPSVVVLWGFQKQFVDCGLLSAKHSREVLRNAGIFIIEDPNPFWQFWHDSPWVPIVKAAVDG